MRLSTFIEENMEPILQAWEDFATTVAAPGKPMDSAGLRDHAEQMLLAIAEDLRTHQTEQERIDKSQGRGPDDGPQTAAETHAVTRLLAGFSLDQMVSEYRALRTSVLGQWMPKIKAGSDFEIQDIIRFNEAIDQALTESIASYSRAVDASRNIFLAILGHDLRTPLGAIFLGADILLRSKDLADRPTKVSAQIYTSVKRANQIVEDLLDFTRSQLGRGIPVRLEEVDLSAVCGRIVEEARAYHHNADIRYEAGTHCTGNYDGARMEQVFSNLISNAAHHGDTSLPITVSLDRAGTDFVFSIHNWGQPIPEEAMPFIFNPMGRFSQHAGKDHGPNAGMGLGLYIASQIVTAHGGNIDVTSQAQQGTTFRVRLPMPGGAR
jgi:signal transduction histidine kinase